MAVVHPGLRRIIFKRFLYITLWHVSIQTLALQLIASIDFSERPVLWLITWLGNVVKLRFFAIALFQSFLSIVFILTESIQYLKVNPCENMTRFRYICQKLSPNNVTWFLVYFLRGILTVIVFFIALKNYFVYPTDKADIKKSNTAVTETIIILINNSIWMNVWFFFNDFIFQKSFKYFSLIQHNYSLTMPTMFATTKNVSVKSVYYCFMFIVFYLLRGFSFCNFLCYLFSVSANISYSTIFSPYVLFSLWLLNAYFLFNILILKLLFDIFLVSRVEFPIVTDVQSQQSDSFVLRDALSTYNVPLLQYLAYYDLNIVSQFDRRRRMEIFTLSYPGGHPYTWKELSSEAIKLITDTVTQLENLTSPKSFVTETSDKKCPPIERYYPNVRPLSPRNFARYPLNEKKVDDGIFKDAFNFIKTIRLVAYLIEELKDKQLEAALQRYQSISLACLSLANLAAISIAEDKYGIIQQDLAAIIHVLLRLFVTLNKLVVINKKTNASLLQVRKNMLSVVRSSLYKIAINFGGYVRDLSLSPEDQKLFENFIHFKN